jgi:hypothetical protein
MLLTIVVVAADAGDAGSKSALPGRAIAKVVNNTKILLRLITFAPSISIST